MVSCFLATCPQSHRRPRDLVRRHWSHLVSEATPVWAVLVDDRPAIVAPADDQLVVVCGGMRAVDWTIGFGHITEVSSARSVVYVVDDDGHCYDFTFLDSGDAVRAALLIDQRRATARGTAGDAPAGGMDTIRRWEGWRAMAPIGQGDAEQVDFGRGAQAGAEPVAPAEHGPEPARTSLVKEPAEPAAEGARNGHAVAAPTAVENGGATVAEAAENTPEPADAAPEETAQVLGDVAEPADEPLGSASGEVGPSEIASSEFESPMGGFAELPIEREVAMAIARSGGEPVDWWSIPPRGSEPMPRPQPLPIPAQATPPASESVLLVTTEAVHGRVVLEVHGDVLAVASWPPPGPSGRSVHEVARDRLAQAVLRRGGNALVGMRYGATGMVGGDVVAYGTAITLAPAATAAAADAEASGARGSADR